MQAFRKMCALAGQFDHISKEGNASEVAGSVANAGGFSSRKGSGTVENLVSVQLLIHRPELSGALLDGGVAGVSALLSDPI